MNSELLATFYVVKVVNGEFCKNREGGIAAKRLSTPKAFGARRRNTVETQAQN
jgi:hypothetical protein